jgi:hypothetical protein
MQEHKLKARPKTLSARRRAVGRRKSVGIPAWQLKLPAGFSSDGKKMASLKQVLAPEIPTRDFGELAPEQQAILTAERIRRQPRYKMGMVGAGVIDQKRAIAEVKAQTDVGRTLMEIEQRTIRMLKEKAKR